VASLSDVTRVIGGNVGGRFEEGEEEGRASGGDTPSGVKGELLALNGETVGWSGAGDVGFDAGPRRWKRK
jgi:hypothetical protein